MQNASEWLVCEHGHLMGLEVWAKLLSGTFQGQGCLLHLKVSSFNANHCLAYVIHVELFTGFKAAQDGWLGEVAFDFF